MTIDFARKKILIIDDFADMRQSLKRMLQSFGAVTIDDASTGEQAIRKMKLTPYDIVLCDYNLGYDKKDGQQILEEAKHCGLIKYSTIFMMITAANALEMVLGVVEYRPDEYLTKPFAKEVLRNRLEKLVERKSDLRDIDQAADKKEFRKAIALCDEKIGTKPKNVFELYRLKSKFCAAIGEYDAAMAVYDEVLAVRDIPWARIGRAKIFFYKKDYTRAREAFLKIINENTAFVQAYDCLAETLIELGDLEEAQQVLQVAADLSPKAILRQKTLGGVARRNRDHKQAVKAYKATIRLGKYSYLKEPSDYTGLARVLVDKGSPDEALRVVKNSRKEFEGRADASLQAALMESVIYRKMDLETESSMAVEDAEKLYEELAGEVSTEVAMDMAKAYFAVGDEDKGARLVQDLVRNHHEDKGVLEQAQEVFADADLELEGKEMIEATRREIIDVNDTGVQLVRAGKLDEAIDYFEKAVCGLPDNRVINLNAAQALLMYMQLHGKKDGFLSKSKRYLERVAKINPGGEKYRKLLEIFEDISLADG